MEERKLVDIEEVKDVLGDTINSEGDYRHALRLLDGLSATTEQEIVKPYFDRLSNEVLRATWDAYYMPVNTLSCDEIQKLMDKVLSDKEIGK